MAEQKLALITGAGGGMGQATVERLSRDGFRVAGTDINADGLEVAIATATAEAKGYVCDLTDEAAAHAMVAAVSDEMGPIDVLVNLIGWSGTTRFHEENSAYWRKIMSINFEAILYVTHPVLNGMIERNGGKIVNVSSDAGRVGTSTEAVYSAMKGGLISFSKSLARENARYNVNVNAVCPGPTDTPLLQEEIEANPDIVARMTRLIPFRRLGQPADMAAAISFLAGPDSDYITGQALSVSGGLTMV
jgi:2-hydroxycyclohexanecarboxyl-CoA dehydrogenase